MANLYPQILVTCAKAYELRLNATSKWIDAAQPVQTIYREIYDILAQSPCSKAMCYKIIHVKDFGETDLHHLGTMENISRLACFLKQYGELGDCLVNSVGYSENEARKILDNRLRKYSYIACMLFLYLASSIVKNSLKSRIKRWLKFKLRQLRCKLEDLLKFILILLRKLQMSILAARYFLLAQYWRFKFNARSFFFKIRHSEIFICLESHTWRDLKAKCWHLKGKYLCLKWKLKNSRLVKFYFD